MRFFCAAVIAALLVGPAIAQSDSEHVQRAGEKDKEKSPAEVEADRAAQRAYKNSLSNIPDKAPVDPWGSMRSDGPPKDVTKAKPTPAKRTKTGSAAN